jgi:CheY-like chemotaxis protein
VSETVPEAHAAKILIVDHESGHVRLLETLLGRAGYVHLRSVTDARDALAVYEAFQPDLVLLDLRMPGIGGSEAGSQIGAASPQTKIVLMTADSGHSSDRPTHISSGCAVIDKRTLTPAALTAVWESPAHR